MSSLKRSRRSLDDLAELSDGGSATDTSKRQRTSSPERDNDTDEDDSDLVLQEDLEAYNESQQARRIEENQEVENGVIEEITMLNFMCHEHLTIKLGPLINFIIGHNGSGKSAALTALTLNLGAKALTTNRGGSLKSFIQNNKEQATLIVKIKNQGETGYRQDEFGDSIIIERQFSRNGTSGFKIKSEAGKIISTKKGDVDDITDHYGLQMDNPLTILTQDMARQFLSNSSPAEKYKFFLRGVQLEQLEKDYTLIAEQLETVATTFEEREAGVMQLDQEFQKARDNYRATSRLQELRDKLEKIRMKMVWCQVVMQERKEEDLRKQLEQLQSQIEAAHQEYTTAGDEFDEADQTKDSVTEQLVHAQNQRQPISDQMQSTLDNREKLKNEVQDLLRDQRLAKGGMKKTKEQISMRQEEIAVEEKRLAEQSGGDSTQKLQELEVKKEAKTIAERKANEHSAGEALHRMAVQEAGSAHQKHKEARLPLEAQIQETEAQLKQVQSGNSRQGIYGDAMPRLLKAIEQDKGFRSRPIGPMGDYVSLKNPAWSSILEKFFGNALNGFVVSNKQDQERLTGIMKRMKCSNFPVSIVNDTPIDYRSHEPAQEYNTVLRVLDVEHPLIVKYMVINHQVEQVILVENMSEGREIMFGSRVRNVRSCFSMTKNDSSTGERFAYAGAGVATTYLEGYKGRPRMKASVKDRIEHQNKLLHQQQQALHAHETELMALRAKVDEANKSLARHKRENADLRSAANKAAEALSEFEDLLAEDVSKQGRLEELKKGLAQLEANKAGFEQTYQQYVVALDENKAKRAEDLQSSTAIDQELKAANKAVTELEIQLKNVDAERATALIKKNEADALVKEKEQERDHPDNGLSYHLRNVKRLITEFIGQASAYGPRVAVAENEDMKTLAESYAKTESNIRTQEQRLGGSVAQLKAVYDAAKQKHDTAVQHLKDDKELQQILLSTLNQRRTRWQEFRKHITMRARLGFQHLLSNRAFRGELKVDHRSGLLDIEIQPDETQVGKGKRAAKTLSGGEKSFSQICLIVALWEAIGAPIRCLDEFDVFMDSVNRNLAMKILIEAARNSHGRQFILITPQSMSSLADGPDVKVHKMRDPDRSGVQTTLPFVA